jgi:hypothetical protein
MQVRIVSVGSYEGAALLRTLGFVFAGAEIGASGRTVLYFEDPDRKAEETLLAHEARGVLVNSLDFETGLRWAKDRIFAARRAGGLS